MNFPKPILLFILIFTLSFDKAAAADNLSKAEKAIVSYLNGAEEEEINFLEKVININSGTMNIEGVRAVGQVFDDAFSEIGFNTAWIDLPEELMRAGHLVAELSGDRGKKLLLLGHIDTVFEANSPFQKFERIGDIAKGPGINDMKAGDVVMLFALKALHETGLLEGAQISIMLTGDEEYPGRPFSISRGDMVKMGKAAQVALSFEGAELDTAVVARRGAINWYLSTTGVRAHSGQVFKEKVGAGAIFEAARILNGFYEDVKGEKLLTFNPGLILGGTEVKVDRQNSMGTAYGKTNVVAGSVQVQGGIRAISQDQLDRAMAKMQDITSQNLPKTTAKLVFDEGYPPMSPTKGNMELFEVMRQVNEDMGFPKLRAFDPGDRGAGDISFVAPYVDSIDGLGGKGNHAHTLKEDLDLKALKDLTIRAALLIYRLSLDE